MPLWTDLITPVEATGIARAELELIEQAKAICRGGFRMSWSPLTM